jgi:hypothetical protein
MERHWKKKLARFRIRVLSKMMPPQPIRGKYVFVGYIEGHLFADNL